MAVTSLWEPIVKNRDLREKDMCTSYIKYLEDLIVCVEEYCTVQEQSYNYHYNINRR